MVSSINDAVGCYFKTIGICFSPLLYIKLKYFTIILCWALTNTVGVEAFRNSINAIWSSLPASCDTVHYAGEREHFSSSYEALPAFEISLPPTNGYFRRSRAQVTLFERYFFH